MDFEEFHKTQDSARLLGMLKEWDSEQIQRYNVIHNEWEKNALFYLGKQWLEQTSGVDGYSVLLEDETHYRPVTNLIPRSCDLKRGQILGKNIRPKVATTSDKKEDIDTAVLSTIALRAKRSIDEDDELDRLVVLYAQTFGIGWRCDYKQPLAHEYLEDPQIDKVKTEFFSCPTCGAIDEYKSTCDQCGNTEMEYKREISEQPVLDQQGNPVVNKIPIYELRSIAVDPFRIKCSATNTKKGLEWLTESSIQDISWIKNAFDVEAPGFLPENLKNIKSNNEPPRGLKISESFKSSVNLVHSSTARDVQRSGLSEEDKGKTVLNKSYFKPCKNYPRGRLVIWVDTAVIYDGLPDVPKKNKKIKRWHPYTPFNWRLHPLRFEGIAYIEDGIPIQKKINSLDAMIMEHIDKTAAPERVEFENTLMNNDDNYEGILRVKARPELPGGGIPTYLQHPQMASEVYKMRMQLVAEFEKVLNITEVIQGLRPAGVDTYRGLELLRDAANSSEAETYNNFHKYIRESGQLKLALIQECVINEDPDLIDMMNEIRLNEDMGIDEIKTFTGANVFDTINIVIEETDYIAQSSTAEEDRVNGLLKAMILSPQDLQDPVTKIKLLRKLGMSQMPMPDKADILKSERIVQMIESGRGQEVFPILRPQDNMGIQLRILSEWVKTSKFDSLNPEVQQMGLRVIQVIENKFLAAKNQMMQPPPQGGEQGPPIPPGQGAPPQQP